ncbi:lysine N(6)-hydroxylase/L-ornithine N(5)-oxygenase family protein [Microbulbifer sediminum]|uniref:lysine N(6)-hydroxylase/L-ornithine N(5)-oxygenase family protein n=1 Tax=Microbulbifer sediminum TaxID=2904250 RepID=UPI001F2685F3|nr:SidA/IucD/PvdA family monooxygenase [Microbulbifer sediminum]
MDTPLDLAGIGAGPFNLAVAALLHRQPLAYCFFDRKPSHSWHPGLMLPGAELQTSFLKDLVTPVDPTNPHSFLAYLVARRRFYDFLNADQKAVGRREFADYLGWVAGQLVDSNRLQMGSDVQEVRDRGDFFELELEVSGARKTVPTRNLCIAAGKEAYVPDCARPLLSDHCFHALETGLRQPKVEGRRVAVVGGGQTGAELVLNLLDGHWGKPQQVQWVSRRQNFLPLDESPFTNAWFTPDYVHVFHRLPALRREGLVEAQKLASDGISTTTLKALYQRFYQLVHLDGEGDRIVLLPGRELRDISRTGSYELGMFNSHAGELESCRADLIILCTGLREMLPDCLSTLRDRFAMDGRGRLVLSADFAADLQDAGERQVYVLGSGRYTHGIAEPQLSLAAWRAARVINDLMNRRIYDTGQAGGILQWSTREEMVSAVA